MSKDDIGIIKLFSDLPFELPDKSKKSEKIEDFDKLDFQNYAEVLAKVVNSADAPLTIGIYGGWGTGKTTLMRMIQNKINEKHRNENFTVWFNAWQYEKEAHPIIPLCATLISEIQNDNKLREIGKNIIKSLRAIAYGFKAKAEVEIPSLGKLGLDFSAKDVIDRYGELHDPLLDQSLYFKAFKSLEDSAKELKQKKIIIFIDDLDRCMAEKAVQLLESIKLVLSLKGFVFVLGLAHEVISSFLKTKYKEEYKIEGKDYLDKIIQVPFYLPDHSQCMEKYAKEIMKYQDQTLGDKFESLMKIIGTICKNNPRSVKMLFNNTIILSEIAKSKTGLEDFPPEYFGITWALQNNWHVAARAIRRNHSNICEEISRMSKNESEFRDAIERLKEKSSFEEDNPNYLFIKEILKDQLLFKLLSSDPAKEYLGDRKSREICWTLSKEFTREISHIDKKPEFEKPNLTGELDTGGDMETNPPKIPIDRFDNDKV